MIRLFTRCVLAILLLATVRPAHAQERVHCGLGAGVHSTVGGAADACAGGRSARVLLVYKLPPTRLTARFDALLLHHNFAPTFRPSDLPGPPQSEDALAGLFELQWGGVPAHGARLYAVAGAGFGVAGGGFGENVVRFAWTAGTGVRLGLGAVAAFAEAEYVHVGKSTAPNPIQGDSFRGRDMVPVTVGIVL